MTQKASDSPCHSRAKRRIPVLCRVPVAPSLGSGRASGALRFARLSQIESKLHSHQVFHLRPKRRLDLCYTRTRDSGKHSSPHSKGGITCKRFATSPDEFVFRPLPLLSCY